MDIKLSDLKKAIRFNQEEHYGEGPFGTKQRQFYLLCPIHGLRLIEENVWDACNYDDPLRVPLPKPEDFDMYLAWLREHKPDIHIVE